MLTSQWHQSFVITTNPHICRENPWKGTFTCFPCSTHVHTHPRWTRWGCSRRSTVCHSLRQFPSCPSPSFKEEPNQPDVRRKRTRRLQHHEVSSPPAVCCSRGGRRHWLVDVISHYTPSHHFKSKSCLATKLDKDSLLSIIYMHWFIFNPLLGPCSVSGMSLAGGWWVPFALCDACGVKQGPKTWEAPASFHKCSHA